MKTVNRVRALLPPVLLSFIVLFMVLYSLNSFKIMTNETANFSLMQNAAGAAGKIGVYSDYELSSIVGASYAVAASDTADTEDLTELLENLLEGTSFDEVAYIGADGNGITSSGRIISSRDFYFFQDVFSGAAGMYIDNKTDNVRDISINFCTPVRAGKETEGVLIGSISVDDHIRPMLETSFVGSDLYGMLCDTDGNIIASTVDLQGTSDIISYAIASGVKEKWLGVIKNSLSEKTTTVFEFRSSDGKSIGCYSNVKDTDLRVLYILPAHTLKTTLQNTNRSNKIVFTIILLAFIVYIFFINRSAKQKTRLITIENQKLAKENLKEKERLFEMNGTVKVLAEEYAALYYTELFTDNTVAYRMDDFARSAYGEQFLEGNRNFFEVINERYIDQYVHPDDVIMFRKLCTEKNVYNELKERKSYSLCFRVRRGTEEYSNYALHMLKIGSISSEPGPVLLGFINRDHQVQLEQELKLSAEREAVLKDRTEKLSADVCTDVLTGLLNRRAYEDNWNKFIENPPEEDYVYVAFDVNGLKNINDNLGHEAGDEIIKAAAKCMKAVFGPFGRVYRIGGDEFAAVLFVSPEKLESLKDDFQNVISHWSGKLVKELSVSAGFVFSSEFPGESMALIAKTADVRMYREKSRYYNKKGIDRRGSQDILTVLGNTYSNIVKVVLNEDSCAEIRIDESEREFFSETFSKWTSRIAESGIICKDDVEGYRSVTDISYLREYFDNNSSLLFRYKKISDGKMKSTLLEILRSKDYDEDVQLVYLYEKIIEDKT
ncbi:MAG: sensor domain-containing diguanylate cyclase [Oscillospiraceae bacterium]|nr:sensor domain-containing diguanylate cyclase [Oscillospiraceae bacterium]